MGGRGLLNSQGTAEGSLPSCLLSSLVVMAWEAQPSTCLHYSPGIVLLCPPLNPPLSPQHGGVRGPLHPPGHHGEWAAQVSRQHSAPEEQVRAWQEFSMSAWGPAACVCCWAVGGWILVVG